jgi:hypothetical protein
VAQRLLQPIGDDGRAIFNACAIRHGEISVLSVRSVGR